jgi:hypothetical protein
MPSPCTVCMRSDRAEVDRRLAQERVNLTALAGTLGMGRKALERHRDRHVPSVLARVQAEVHAETSSELAVELARLYELTLDALAAAESATLSHIDHANGSHPTASHAAIARLVDDARQHVGSLTQLFLDTAEALEPAPPLDPQQLADRITAQLAAVVESAASVNSKRTNFDGDIDRSRWGTSPRDTGQ